MTDGTTDETPGDGGLEAGPDLDELFGPIAEEPLEERSAEWDPAPRTDDERGDDETATAVFDRLKADEPADTDAVLEDDRPREIIASADEPAPPMDEPAVDSTSLVDEDALEALLLPDRTEGEEFLWIDAGDAPLESTADESTDDGELAGEEPAATDGTLEEGGADSPTANAGTERAESDATEGNAASRESAAAEGGPLDLAAIKSEAASGETSLVIPAESELVPAEDADGEGTTGILGWLRSKLGLS